MPLRFSLVLLFSLIFLPVNFAQEDCSAAPPARLRTGMTAETTSGQSNNVRDAADEDANRIGQIPPDSQFQVLGDATCADGYYWYQIDYHGLQGWTVEGADGEYWLRPVFSNTAVISPENINQLQLIDTLSCPEGNGASVIAWSYPDNSHLYWECFTNQASYYLTDWVNKETIEIRLSDDAPRNYGLRNFVAFYASGTRFILNFPTEFTIWDSGTGENIASYSHFGTVSSSAIYGNTFAFEDMEGIHVVDLSSLEESHRLDDSSFDMQLTFSPDGRRLAFLTYDTVRIWTIETDEILEIPLAQINEMVPDVNQAHVLRFSPSGRYLLLALCEVPNRGDCFEPVLSWVDASTGELTTTWQEDDWDNIWDIQFGNDLVFYTVDNRFEAIQISTDQRIYTSNELDSYPTQILVTVDGRLLIEPDQNNLLIYGIPN